MHHREVMLLQQEAPPRKLSRQLQNCRATECLLKFQECPFLLLPPHPPLRFFQEFIKGKGMGGEIVDELSIGGKHDTSGVCH